jgi:hypothetical protein
MTYRTFPADALVRAAAKARLARKSPETSRALLALLFAPFEDAIDYARPRSPSRGGVLGLDSATYLGARFLAERFRDEEKLTSLLEGMLRKDHTVAYFWRTVVNFVRDVVYEQRDGEAGDDGILLGLDAELAEEQHHGRKDVDADVAKLKERDRAIVRGALQQLREEDFEAIGRRRRIPAANVCDEYEAWLRPREHAEDDRTRERAVRNVERFRRKRRIDALLDELAGRPDAPALGRPPERTRKPRVRRSLRRIPTPVLVELLAHEDQRLGEVLRRIEVLRAAIEKSLDAAGPRDWLGLARVLGEVPGRATPAAQETAAGSLRRRFTRLMDRLRENAARRDGEEDH